MRRTAASIVAVFLLLLLAACGGEADTPPAGSKADRTKAALERLFAAVRAGDPTTIARLIVYRGKDPARKYTSVYDVANDDPVAIKRAMDEIRHKLGTGTPTFLEFRSERESEGEWLAWQVKTSKGTYWFACLDIDGQIALGDID